MTVLATDSFTRADEVPVATPWVTGAGNAAFNLLSGVLRRGDEASDSWAYYDGSISWPDDQYAKMVVTGVGSGGSFQGLGPMVRKVSGATLTMYRLIVDHAATNNCSLQRMLTGSMTPLAQFTQAWTDGDTWELRAVGTTLSMWLNGSQVGGDQTDGNITSGFPGAAYSSGDGFCGVDDWEGGTPSGGGGGGPIFIPVMQQVRLRV